MRFLPVQADYTTAGEWPAQANGDARDTKTVYACPSCGAHTTSPDTHVCRRRK
ncbi:hypothetical protein SAMN05421505_1627 [Sinosporangium album]|uniref:Uncharacterized protein n=1 Tax=Sinosporangium album TaxID=504805 RepID=A0A1G8L6J4_9ACTN|nr:hypothetical protein SAMN05421505_1627 [Sinosporangium album]